MSLLQVFGGKTLFIGIGVCDSGCWKFIERIAQKGRTRGASVVDVASDEASIVKGLQKVLSPNFRAFCKTTTNPYEKEGTAESIFKVISTYSLDTFLQKSFYNL